MISMRCSKCGKPSTRLAPPAAFSALHFAMTRRELRGDEQGRLAFCGFCASRYTDPQNAIESPNAHARRLDTSRRLRLAR